MIDITTIHIHCVSDENAKGKRKRIIRKIVPSDNENKLAIQQDIGEEVRKQRDTGKWQYYYVVLEINRGGKPAYRTVIPKTLF